jgi:DtxR family transcriptional regulator, Mn-dependent transcriptional regulator
VSKWLVSDAAETPLTPISASAGRYLEAAYYIAQEGEVVRPGRLADWLGVAAPTVTQGLARLARDRLVTIGPDRHVEFTSEGWRTAEAIVRRHRVAEVWLNRELGFDWVTADAEAQALAGVLSDRVLDRLQKALGDPTTCPHGNPIPGVPQPARELHNLADLAPSQTVRIGRISEVAEHEAPQLLNLLYAAGLTPGVGITVEQKPESASEPGVALTAANGRVHWLPVRAARAVWVELGPAVPAVVAGSGTGGQGGELPHQA